jgi:molybdenum cofactor biosynthesis enzyme
MHSAQARASVTLNPRATRALLVQPHGGEVLTAARTAGIAAIEQTPSLLGAHTGVQFTGVALDLVVGPNEVEISGLVHTSDDVDVATQALTAVTVAAISLIGHVRDLCASASIEYVRLEDTGHRLGGAPTARSTSGI